MLDLNLLKGSPEYPGWLEGTAAQTGVEQREGKTAPVGSLRPGMESTPGLA